VATLIDPAGLEPVQRYRLAISLIVPRPIGWISTQSMDGTPNLAPFSYFNALSASPFLVGASIGRRGGGPKDTLMNIRQTGVFVVNLVGEHHLEPMVRTSGSWPPDVDEFQDAGLTVAPATRIDAPCVSDAVASLECRLFREVDLGASPNALVIGQVVAVRLGAGVRHDPESGHVDVDSLRPVGRLGRDEYALLGEVRRVARPTAENAPDGG
jgi:flavin reductase (DIM6/NTAB) family NADH-FMN oxidoreductase RutF